MIGDKILVHISPTEKSLTQKVLELFLDKYRGRNIGVEVRHAVRSDIDIIKHVLKNNHLLAEDKLIDKDKVIAILQDLEYKAIDGAMERYIQEKIEEVRRS